MMVDTSVTGMGSLFSTVRYLDSWWRLNWRKVCVVKALVTGGRLRDRFAQLQDASS
jgi:hypothetical protein